MDADLSRIQGVPGRLCLAPTQAGLLAVYPHGGTALGAVRECRFRWGTRYRDVVAEDWLEVVETHRVADLPVFSFELDDFDPDVLALIFPRVVTGTGPAGYQGTRRIDGAGAPGVQVALDPLLFSALDQALPSLLIHRGIPRLVEDAELALASGELAAVAILVRPSRTSSAPARAWQLAPIEQLEVGP